MHIAFVAYNNYHPRWTSSDLLDEFFTARDWAKALSKTGNTVDLYFRFHSHCLEQDGQITYQFIKDFLPAEIRNFHLPLIYIRKVSKDIKLRKPDIIHAHNLESVLSHLALRLLVDKKIPLVVQDHGSLPRKRLHYLQKLIFPYISGFIFSAKGQESAWISRGLISDPDKCFFVPENSSHFKYTSREIARSITMMQGNPVFLWVGNLNRNKDPLTILDAFEQVAPEMTDPRLYMIYRQNDLEPQIKIKIKKSMILEKSVVLLGSMRHNDLEIYYNSADFFILGSHKEAFGYSAIEAISCGVIPIITDIDSYRFMTGNGRIGVLWKPGNARNLKNNLRKLTSLDLENQRRKTLKYFYRYLIFEMLSKHCSQVYHEIIRTKEQ